MTDTPAEQHQPKQGNRWDAPVDGFMVQAGHVAGGIHYHYPTPKIGPPKQLPPARRSWTDRPELAELDRLTQPDRAVVVLTGPAGVGKTALALHWAHRHLDRFPDGQLYADLDNSPTEGTPPLGGILRDWLLALGASEDGLPKSLSELESLAWLVADFRTRTADRRLLVLLDDADSAAQVRTLLSASPHCVTLVTSRFRIAAGLMAEGAQQMFVGKLTLL